MTASDRCVAQLERLASLVFRMREQRDLTVAQRLGEMLVEEAEVHQAGMICTVSHRRRHGRKSKNLLSGSRESQPRITLELYLHLHHAVIVQEHSLQGHRHRHRIYQENVSSKLWHSCKLYIRVFESLYYERLQQRRIFLREQHLGQEIKFSVSARFLRGRSSNHR